MDSSRRSIKVKAAVAPASAPPSPTNNEKPVARLNYSMTDFFHGSLDCLDAWKNYRSDSYVVRAEEVKQKKYKRVERLEYVKRRVKVKERRVRTERRKKIKPPRFIKVRRTRQEVKKTKIKAKKPKEEQPKKEEVLPPPAPPLALPPSTPKEPVPKVAVPSSSYKPPPSPIKIQRNTPIAAPPTKSPSKTKTKPPPAPPRPQNSFSSRSSSSSSSSPIPASPTKKTPSTPRKSPTKTTKKKATTTTIAQRVAPPPPPPLSPVPLTPKVQKPKVEPPPTKEAGTSEVFIALTVQDCNTEPLPKDFKKLAMATQIFYDRYLKKEYGKLFYDICVGVKKTAFNTNVPSALYNIYIEWDIKARFRDPDDQSNASFLASPKRKAAAGERNKIVPDNYELCRALVGSLDMQYLNLICTVGPFARTKGMFTEQIVKYNNN